MSGLWRGEIVRSEAQLMKKAFAARANAFPNSPAVAGIGDPGPGAAQRPASTMPATTLSADIALRFVRDDLWRGFAHFELGAYFLDLSGLLFELGC